MKTKTIKAHFNGDQIVVDDPVELEPNTKLLITIIAKPDEEHDAWVSLSKNRLEQAYDSNEMDYSLNLIKELNPYYEGI